MLKLSAINAILAVAAPFGQTCVPGNTFPMTICVKYIKILFSSFGGEGF